MASRAGSVDGGHLPRDQAFNGYNLIVPSSEDAGVMVGGVAIQGPVGRDHMDILAPTAPDGGHEVEESPSQRRHGPILPPASTTPLAEGFSIALPGLESACSYRLHSRRWRL